MKTRFITVALALASVALATTAARPKPARAQCWYCDPRAEECTISTGELAFHECNSDEFGCYQLFPCRARFGQVNQDGTLTSSDDTKRLNDTKTTHSSGSDPYIRGCGGVILARHYSEAASREIRVASETLVL